VGKLHIRLRTQQYKQYRDSYAALGMHHSNYMRTLNRFPSFEPPYEHTTHKDVRGNNRLFVALPFGKRCYAWFTHYKEQNVCFIVGLSPGRLQPTSVHPVITSFNSRLALGTVIYGTVVHRNDTSCFVMDDLLYDTGRDTTKIPYMQKLERFGELCSTQLGHDIHHSKQMVFVLPEMALDIVSMNRRLGTLQYPHHCILSVNLYGRTKRVKVIIKTVHKSVFLVKPRVKSDTYELHVQDNAKVCFHSIACVDTYKLSVVMNDTFRTVRENHYLDAIEESDDEDDFQDVSPDKHVHLDREFKILCKWNQRIKRWIPVEKVDDRTQLATMHEATRLERQFR